MTNIKDLITQYKKVEEKKGREKEGKRKSGKNVILKGNNYQAFRFGLLSIWIIIVTHLGYIKVKTESLLYTLLTMYV